MEQYLERKITYAKGTGREMNYKLSFLILVLIMCPLTLLAKQKDDFLEIKNKILTVRQDLTRDGVC